MSYTYNPLDLNEGNVQSTLPPKIGKEKKKLPDKHGYEFVRYGEPGEHSLEFENHARDIQRCVDHYLQFGYDNALPELESLEFKRHIAKFRAVLDSWEMIPITKVFTKDEIYIRSLTEGPAYAEFIKKCRSTTLRGLTAITETDIDEDYYFPDGYAGYDSIIHERNLIYWNHTDVDDVKYAFMPTHGRTEDFEEIAERFLSTLKLDQSEFDLQLDTLEELKNSKMYDPKTRKTSLMREFWTDEVDLSSPYLAKRAVVYVEPGNTRDTGVGDPSTVAKVKAVTRLCRTILERITHSANCPAELSSKRIARILEKNTYIHLDFKKYGLAFVRQLQNLMLKKIGERWQIDVADLLINDFYFEIDGVIYSTERGSTLGWFDCLSEICVHAILWNLSFEEGLGFDWIAFNDDVEISFYSSESSQVEKAEMIRDVVLSRFNQLDILLSISKTYGSRASLFLEKYFRFGEHYGLDMQKRQLSCKMYGRSLVARQPWQAKLYFSAGYSIWGSEELTTRCIATCDQEFDPVEQSGSLFCGGWYQTIDANLDRSLEESGDRMQNLGRALQMVHLPDISTKPEKVTSTIEIEICKSRLIPDCKDAEDGRDKFTMTDTTFDVNFEISGMTDTYPLRVMSYTGRNNYFVENYTRLMSRIKDENARYDPG